MSNDTYRLNAQTTKRYYAECNNINETVDFLKPVFQMKNAKGSVTHTLNIIDICHACVSS